MHVRRLDLKEYIEVVELFIIGVGNVLHNITVQGTKELIKIVEKSNVKISLWLLHVISMFYVQILV